MDKCVARRASYDGIVTSEAIWSPDDSHFAVNVGVANEPVRTIIKTSSGSGSETIVRESERNANDAPTDWSPDGRYLLTERYDGQRFLLNAAADENSRPLTLVLNWNAELKR